MHGRLIRFMKRNSRKGRFVKGSVNKIEPLPRDEESEDSEEEARKKKLKEMIESKVKLKKLTSGDFSKV